MVDYSKDDEEDDGGLGNKDGETKMEASLLGKGLKMSTKIISIDDSYSDKPSRFVSWGGYKARIRGKKRYISSSKETSKEGYSLGKPDTGSTCFEDDPPNTEPTQVQGLKGKIKLWIIIPKRRYKNVYGKKRHFEEALRIGRHGHQWKAIQNVQRALKAIQNPWYNKQCFKGKKWMITLASNQVEA